MCVGGWLKGGDNKNVRVSLGWISRNFTEFHRDKLLQKDWVGVNSSRQMCMQ